MEVIKKLLHGFKDIPETEFENSFKYRDLHCSQWQLPHVLYADEVVGISFKVN